MNKKYNNKMNKNILKQIKKKEDIQFQNYEKRKKNY